MKMNGEPWQVRCAHGRRMVPRAGASARARGMGWNGIEWNRQLWLVRCAHWRRLEAGERCREPERVSEPEPGTRNGMSGRKGNEMDCKAEEWNGLENSDGAVVLTVEGRGLRRMSGARAGAMSVEVCISAHCTMQLLHTQSTENSRYAVLAVCSTLQHAVFAA
jgi:hypothetical protein